MLILGGRYGSIEPKSGKSYIELEYDYAVANKKPLFAAVISEEYLEAKVKTTGSSAIETVNGNLLADFRIKVTSKICRFFKDSTELKLIVFQSISNLERNEGLAGWVRGTDVLDPKTTLEELSRLQTENVSLRNQLEDARTLLSSISNQQSVKQTLTEDAVDLLVSAANADGYILYTQYLGGSSMQAGDRDFLETDDTREEARWKSALDELLGLRLVEGVGYKGETFRVTKSGYDVADQIKTKSESNDSDTENGT
jgi:hypothetical protein